MPVFLTSVSLPDDETRDTEERDTESRVMGLEPGDDVVLTPG